MIKRHWQLVTLIVIGAFVICIGAIAMTQIAEKEQIVSISQVPAEVKVTILAEAQGGTIDEIEMETEDGQVIYEADIIIEGQEFEITVASDGKLLGREIDDEDDENDKDVDDDDDIDDEEHEELVSIDQVPPVIAESILKAAAGAEIEEIEKEVENGQVVYEADVIIDGQEIEIKVAENGSLLGREVDDEDTEEDDD